MNPEKKVKLINAAMKEFGENRFDKASTNVIVKEAGISKGLLYHYFKSKETLYDYLVDYAMNSVATPIAEIIGLEECDIIKRIEQILKLKLEVIDEYPALIPFSKVMYAGYDYEQIKKMIEKYNTIPMDMYFQHNVDETLFKEGVDVEMAVKTIQYTLEKVSDGFMTQRNMGLDPPMETVLTEVTGFLEHFRKMYYK